VGILFVLVTKTVNPALFVYFFFIFSAETLGFTTYAPAYLSPQASGKNLLIGANFASAASGYYDETAYLYVSTRILLLFLVCNL
jgi:hypothetical protein